MEKFPFEEAERGWLSGGNRLDISVVCVDFDYAQNSKKTFVQAVTFNPIPLTLPRFLNKNFEYELAYVPSQSDAARNITKMVKKDLNFNFKV